VQNLIDQGKLKRMEFVCSIDCWGPEIEYVRDGLILEDWENNINTLVDTPGVSINIHSTLTALTLPTLYQLIEKTVSWQRPDKYVGINWNTVVSPTPFNPYHFGEHLAPFIDTAIETLQKFPDFTESINLQKHLYGIKQQLISTPVNKEEVANLVGFLDEIDIRRNRSWRKVFPQIEKIVNTINTGEL
jgi:hypothetical protein